MARGILAHELLVGERRYKLHIAKIDSATGELIVEPFACETPATEFIDGAVEVWVDKESGLLRWRSID